MKQYYITEDQLAKVYSLLINIRQTDGRDAQIPYHYHLKRLLKKVSDQPVNGKPPAKVD